LSMPTSTATLSRMKHRTLFTFIMKLLTKTTTQTCFRMLVDICLFPACLRPPASFLCNINHHARHELNH
jgi:hypothetical protein